MLCRDITKLAKTVILATTLMGMRSKETHGHELAITVSLQALMAGS